MKNGTIAAHDAVVCWSDGGIVRVMHRIQPLPKTDKWTPYAGLKGVSASIVLMADAIKMMTADGCNPRQVHSEMLKIREYAIRQAYDHGGIDDENEVE
jgi:hypothetical protein